VRRGGGHAADDAGAVVLRDGHVVADVALAKLGGRQTQARGAG
jgi:hypothetical protein